SPWYASLPLTSGRAERVPLEKEVVMKQLLERCTLQMKTAGEKFPWTSRKVYGDWLAQTYYYVRHSTRLLAAAAARFPLDERGSALHYRFAAHIGEEKRHEQLALHDLQQLGFTLAEF